MENANLIPFRSIHKKNSIFIFGHDPHINSIIFTHSLLKLFIKNTNDLHFHSHNISYSVSYSPLTLYLLNPCH